MRIITKSIVRGTAQPGVEVEFRGEDGERVSLQIKSDDVASLDDEQVYLRAKQMLTQIIAFNGDVANDTSLPTT
jgi:hypothetical protein